MLFSSLEFLYLFLPVTCLCYFLSPLRARNAVLLAVSLIFYGSGEPIYLFLMVGTVIADYAFGYGIERAPRRARLLLWSAVIFNLALLGFFKYYGFFASFLPLPSLSLSLPIGISFYTFQALSYVIDVYRHTVSASHSLVDFGTYVTLFPQLIAGPIVKYTDVERELKVRKTTLSGAAEGARRFAVGLAKKVLLANRAGQMWEALRVSHADDPTLLGAWAGLICFAFQIYFDFSGYSDMAIGLGKIFGFSFPENFRYPYAARSITDFWRRWHISLSSWFREYVYIPLGGNRRGRWRTYRNLFITWALTGLWHGASWSFLLWGLYFFCILSLEKAYFGRVLSRLPRVACHAYALFFILLGWLIFVFDGSTPLLSLMQGLHYAGTLFGIGTPGFVNGFVSYELWRQFPWLVAMALGCTPLLRHAWNRITDAMPRAAALLSPLLVGGSLMLCTAYLVSSGYNPFLYFRF